MNKSAQTNYYAKRQARILGLVSGAFKDPSLYELEDVLDVKEESYKNTEPPDEGVFGKALFYTENLFLQLASFYLEFKELPARLDFSKFGEKSCWVYSNGEFETNRCYAVGGGEILSLSQVIENYGSEAVAKTIRSGEIRRTKRVNLNPDCRERQKIAFMAMNCFLYQFLCSSGANFEVLKKAIIDEDISFEVTRPKFRAFKARANGKEIAIEFGTQVYGMLRVYLRLRRKLLGGRGCQLLFFNSEFQEVTDSFYKRTERFLNKVNSPIALPRSRQTRANKADYLMRNFGLEVASDILQNSSGTLARHYAAGRESDTARELSNFYDSILSQVVSRNTLVDIVSVGVGSCRGFGQPASSDSEVNSNCTDPEGCVFCDKFIVCTDDEDVRKLLSCKFFLNKLSASAGDADFNFSIYNKYIGRIDCILREVASSSVQVEKMIKSIEVEVSKGDCLDPYWESKLEMLISIGVITDEPTI